MLDNKYRVPILDCPLFAAAANNCNACTDKGDLYSLFIFNVLGGFVSRVPIVLGGVQHGQES